MGCPIPNSLSGFIAGQILNLIMHIVIQAWNLAQLEFMMKQKFWAGGATSNVALYGIKGPFMPKYGKFCFSLQWTPYI